MIICDLSGETKIVCRRKLKAGNTTSALSAGLHSQNASRERADLRTVKLFSYHRRGMSKNGKMKSRSHCPENHPRSGAKDVEHSNSRLQATAAFQYQISGNPVYRDLAQSLEDRV